VLPSFNSATCLCETLTWGFHPVIWERVMQVGLVFGIHQRLLPGVLLSNQHWPDSYSERFSISWNGDAERGEIGGVYLGMELHSFPSRRYFLLWNAREGVVQFRPG